MNRVDNQRFYYSAISEHGYSPEALCWHSQESQEVRFYQILSLLPTDACSVVDAGCGFGDLCGYIDAFGKHTVEYVGLDSLDRMVSEAKRRTDKEIFKCDILYDLLPKREFYLCSGALNILTRTAAYLFIKRCYSASSRGMIFNFLEGDKESKTYNYLRAERIQKLGTTLGARVVFRRNYYDKDCTVAFYKECY